jgi:hypothetical protein
MLELFKPAGDEEPSSQRSRQTTTVCGTVDPLHARSAASPPLSPRLPIAGRYVKERLPEALRSQRLPDLAGIMIKGNMYSTTPKPAAPAAAKRPKEDHSLNIIASFAAKLSLITPPLLADSARQSRPASAQPMHRHLAPSLRRRS